MDNHKLTPLVIFIFCSAFNENLSCINYLFNKYLVVKYKISKKV